MSDIDHARELLEMARGDLNALRGMLKSDELTGESYFSDEVFGFHAQQAVEKCLKAWLAHVGKPYPRSHDLMLLVQLVETIEPDVSELYGLVDLNSFAVQFRYESLVPDDEELERRILFDEIESLFLRVEQILA